jgi:MoaA/NifB/PqqE/SkfB family radical SAM enzyme
MPYNTETAVLDPGLRVGEAHRLPHQLSSIPILLFHVHENCNCRCVMCDIWRRDGGREIDLQWLERQRPSIERLGVKQVVLTGGEPLLHSRFKELCVILKDSGVRITLLTTGLLLAKRAESVAESVDEVIVSLDGPAEVHDQIRRVKGAFSLMRDGIRAVRQHRPAMPAHARTTIQKMNHRLLRQTVKAARLLSLDSISFLAADVTSSAFNHDLVWPGEQLRQVVLTRTEVEDLEAEIEALVRENSIDFETCFILESRKKLRGIARRFREQLGDFAPRAPLCNAPWVSAVIEVDGGVRPCFFHPKIGDASAMPLDTAINSATAVGFRRSLDVDNNPTCKNCVCSLNYKG